MKANDIKRKLDAGGTKHSWFADQMGVSPTLVSLWFSGERDMTAEQETKANKVFEVLTGAVV